MLHWVKKASIAGVAAIALTAATVATSAPANAQRFGGFRGGGFHGGFHGGGWHGGGWHGGWRGGRGWGWGPAIVGGVALGALATAPYWGGYGYGYGCGPYGQVVRYDAWGRPVVVDNCW